jgi:hypothetical protein
MRISAEVNAPVGSEKKKPPSIVRMLGGFSVPASRVRR